MIICSKCGAEIAEDAVTCPSCGTETAYGVAKKEEKAAKNARMLGVLSIVAGALGGWLGIIIGIFCIKTDKTGKYKKLGIIGICLSVVWFVVLIAMVTLGESAV